MIKHLYKVRELAIRIAEARAFGQREGQARSPRPACAWHGRAVWLEKSEEAGAVGSKGRGPQGWWVLLRMPVFPRK